MTDALDLLIRSDRELFLWLNGLHTPWLDPIMYWITYKYTWIPMYVVLIAFTLVADRKKGFAALITVILAVIFADQITSGFMKPYFIRFRPCHDPTLRGMVHEVAGCGGLYGFASSHASTSFAVAITWFTFLKGKVKYPGLLFVWAITYSYSRIYVGVHYPLDILVGALVGLLVGYCCIQLYYIFLKRYYLN
ncbi:phosphatase PAP2 family protein [Dyadobacter crusticola]|uniref:phosphatase PAP2 family protein n=1 Tax=Dyadobacter crusticola TaxID=292407 RepID=UPI0004E1879A|nr:phosphatase PAP2 family protein [Dyadobacter crusticola]